MPYDVRRRRPDHSPPVGSMVGRIVRMLRRLETGTDRQVMREWLDLAGEMELFGDLLPVHWSRCDDVRNMMELLRHAPGLVKRADVVRRSKTTSLSDDALQPGAVPLPGAQLILVVEHPDGRVAEHVGTPYEAEALAWLREQVPSVAWSDLKP